METRPGEGAVKKEEFPNRKPSHNWVCGEFWDLRGQHNWEETKQNKTQNRRLTATAIGEVTQMLASATSERGLDREAQVAS